jgi:hypothetical protein
MLRTLFVVAAVAWAACSTETKTTTGWRDPSYGGGPMTNALVVGAAVDSASRRTLEDALALALRTSGVRAAASYTVFESLPPNADALRGAAFQAGIDWIVVARLRSVHEQTSVSPAAGPAGARVLDDEAGWPAWNAPVVTTDEIVAFETTVWDARTRKLVWTAFTQTTNPKSGKDFATSLAKELTQSWSAASLLPGHGPERVTLSSGA